MRSRALTSDTQKKMADFLVFAADQWLLFSILCGLVIAFIALEQKRAGAQLDIHQVTRMVNNDEAILVDVRDVKEFSKGHIVDAYNVPYAKLAERKVELEKHKAKTLIVLDKMGQHAGAAVKILEEAGFTAVRMRGGMSEWEAQSLPVVKS
jgi:rhodanese-related sulfurtransferase